MEPDELFVEIRIRIVIIPITELNVARNSGTHLLRNIRMEIVISLRLVAETEVHIGPDDRPESVFLTEPVDPSEVTVEQLKRRFITVMIKEPAASEVVRFIHADVQTAA